MGAHLELPKSNEKCKATYVLNEYAYFGQEINFHEVWQVQPLDAAKDEILSMKELSSLLQKKEDLIFPQEELIHINIGTSNDERLIQIGAALSPPQ